MQALHDHLGAEGEGGGDDDDEEKELSRFRKWVFDFEKWG